MDTFFGKSACEGIAIGRLMFWKKNKKEITKAHTVDKSKELSNFNIAVQTAINQLDVLKQKAITEVGEDNAEIFEIHKLMIQDDDYLESIKDLIINCDFNAEYAIHCTCKKLVESFSSMDDSYMKARVVDVKDISDRLISILNNKNSNTLNQSEPVILVADDFTPSETIQFDKSKILAFVTTKGSINSHTAILARTLNIPAIIGIDIINHDKFNHKIAVVDGITGTLHIEPDSTCLTEYQEKLNEENNKNKLLQTMIGKESVTMDGKKIMLYANIGNINDLSKVIENDASGIGLFRSEFIFLEKNTYPSEEEQFSIYKNAVETMNGKKVIIRTLDIGADKNVDYFNLNQEENPALGLRAIRLCLKRKDIFKTQLRALLRAAVYGNLSIMFPMIISTNELHEINDIISEVSKELSSQGIPYKIPEQGIMIETPASVVISNELAKGVSFFSIGTNDLSQYTLAIDRQNQELDDFFDPHHPAIMKMIETTIESAHRNGIWVGICGELASDLSLTESFIKLGVDELSVSPSKLLSVRKKIRESNSNNKK